MRPLNVLIGMETSGRTREAFRALGHNAISADLLDATDGSPHHLKCNVFDVLDGPDPVWKDPADGPRRPWDLAIFHPTCTYLAVSGLHWNGRVEGRAEKTEAALEDVRRLMAAPIKHKAIENPVGCISSRIRKPDQLFQPYEFGDDASKKTCLWLENLPQLVIDPAQRLPGRRVEWPRGSGKFVERWANQTDSGQNALTPSADRWAARSVTYPGFATAAAVQWSAYVLAVLAGSPPVPEGRLL